MTRTHQQRTGALGRREGFRWAWRAVGVVCFLCLLPGCMRTCLEEPEEIPRLTEGNVPRHPARVARRLELWLVAGTPLMDESRTHTVAVDGDGAWDESPFARVSRIFLARLARGDRHVAVTRGPAADAQYRLTAEVFRPADDTVPWVRLRLHAVGSDRAWTHKERLRLRP